MNIAAISIAASNYSQTKATASPEPSPSAAAVTMAATPSNAQNIQAFEQRTGLRGLEHISGFDFGSLLNSDTRNQLLQEQNTSGITGPEWLARTYNDPKTALTNPDQPISGTPTYLTDGDLDFLHKATGLNFVLMPDGGSCWLDDQGNYPKVPEETLKEYNLLAGQMDIDRRVGTLTGSITKTYIDKLFAREAEAGQAIGQDVQDKFLAQFNDDSKASA